MSLQKKKFGNSKIVTHKNKQIEKTNRVFIFLIARLESTISRTQFLNLLIDKYIGLMQKRGNETTFVTMVMNAKYSIHLNNAVNKQLN